MRSSEIKFNVELDDDNIPDKIFWKATDAPTKKMQETRAMTISIWDHHEKDTLQINLWGKEMTIDEMKRFYIDTLGGLANSLRTATNDEFMAGEIEKVCDTLVEHVKKEVGEQ